MAATKKPAAKKTTKTAPKKAAAKKVSSSVTKKALTEVSCCTGGQGLTRK